MFVHYLVVVELSDILTAKPMNMGSIELTDGSAAERVDISASNEAYSLARRRIDVLSHRQTLDSTNDISVVQCRRGSYESSFLTHRAPGPSCSGGIRADQIALLHHEPTRAGTFIR